MTHEADTVGPGQTPMASPAAPTSLPWPRLFYWSVRRELWEHPAIYLAPLVVAAIALLGFAVGAFWLPDAVSAGASQKAAERIAVPYEFAAFAVLVTGLLVAMFYCMSALQNERRDRSILFWKSLPVSDLTTVLSKATMPIVVLPVVMLVVVITTTAIMGAVSTLIVLANGLDVGVLWSHAPVLFVWRTLAGGLPGIALWYAPLYGWLLLVSAWARRVAYLWAIAPPLLLGLVERLAFGTTYVWRWLALRMFGVFAGGARHGGHDGLARHVAAAADPAGWTSPHLWIGIVLAAAFLAGAVWLRRSREPI